MRTNAECGLVGVLEGCLKQAYQTYGKFISKHPLWFIVVPIVLSICLMSGLVRYNYVYDSEYLYTPIDGPAKDERRIMNEYFPSNETHLYISSRKLDLRGFLQIILYSENIYTQAGIQAAIDIDTMMKDYVTTGDDPGITYNQVCSKWMGQCEENPILVLLHHNASNIHEIAIQFPFNGPVFLGFQLGGVITDANGTVIKAETIFLTYNVQYVDDDTDILSSIWLDQVKDVLLRYSIPDITLVFQTSNSLDQELDTATQDIIPLFSATYTILCTFSLLTCLMLDWVRSKMWIALAGQVSAGLAIASAIGLVCAAGVPFASICSTMPFLLMGIGIDNMFVMVAAWRGTSIRDPVSQRMSTSLSLSAVSITLTSLTDCLAFGIGAISPFRSVKYFCAYAGTACAFCYVYSVTFLAACMVYSGRQEEQNKHIASCKSIDHIHALQTKDEAMTIRKFFCWGSAVYHQKDTKAEETVTEPLPDYDGSIPDILHPYITKLIQYPYASYLLSWQGKLITFISYGLYLSISIWACFQLQEGLELKNLAPDDSYLVDFYAYYDPYFNQDYSGRIMVAVTETLDYTNSDDAQKVNALVASFQNDKYFFNEEEYLEFWLHDYQKYLWSRNQTVNNMTQFIDILTNEFLIIEGFDRYMVDVSLNKDKTQIVASRFLIQAKGVQSTTQESELMLQCRELAAESVLITNVYFSAFIFWDQYVVILETTMINLSIAVVCVLFVSLLLVPSFTAVALVAFSISSICTGVVGFMTLWDVNLDSVSMINLILCIGFSVDFSAHICYHFSIAADIEPAQSQMLDAGSCINQNHYELDSSITDKTTSHDLRAKNLGSSKSLDETEKRTASTANLLHTNDLNEPVTNIGDEKATAALSELGFPITQGALSTILAVSILSSSNTYIFRTFFKVIFLVMCFGFYHAVIFLPVVLAFFSDMCCKSSRHKKACATSNSNVAPVIHNSKPDKDMNEACDDKENACATSNSNVAPVIHNSKSDKDMNEACDDKDTIDEKF